MKNTILVLIMLTGGFFTSKAQNTLLLQNNTPKEIHASFVYYDNVEQCWVSRGWRNIAAYGSNSINLDELNMGSNIMYIHAESVFGFKTWGSANSFCSNNGGVMRILYADVSNCKIRKNYDPVSTGTGQTLYTFNP